MSPPQSNDPLVPAREDPPDNRITPPATGTFTRPTGPINNPRLDIELPTINLLRRQAADRIALAEKTIVETAVILEIDLKNKTEIDSNELLATAIVKLNEAKELFAAEATRKPLSKLVSRLSCARPRKNGRVPEPTADWRDRGSRGSERSGSSEKNCQRLELQTFAPTTGQSAQMAAVVGTINVNTDILNSGGSIGGSLGESGGRTVTTTYTEIKPLENRHL